MKALFERDELLAALSPAAAIAPNRNTIASIEGILFKCENGECEITAYDLEKGMKTKIEARIISPGAVIINSQSVLQIVRSMPSGEVLFEVSDKFRVKISSGASSFEINGLQSDVFPTLPLLSGEKNYVLPQHIFRDLIKKSNYAVSTAENRAAFAGVFFRIDNAKLTAVGCDGNRLAVAETALPDDAAPADFIVPGRILFELMKMIRDSEEDITISVARKHVIFSLGDYVYFSRLFDGEFLNYQKILPDGCERSMYVSCEAFRRAMERASLITEDKLGGNSRTFVKLDFKRDVMIISSVSAAGSIYEELPASLEGGEVSSAYTCRYLLEALKAADDRTTVKLSMNGALEGICIEGADSDEESPVSFKFFIMPVRVNK